MAAISLVSCLCITRRRQQNLGYVTPHGLRSEPILNSSQKQEPNYNFVLPHRNPLRCPIGALAILLHYVFDQEELISQVAEWDWSRASTWRQVCSDGYFRLMHSLTCVANGGQAPLRTEGWATLQRRCSSEDVHPVPQAHHNHIPEEAPPRPTHNAHTYGGYGVCFMLFSCSPLRVLAVSM